MYRYKILHVQRGINAEEMINTHAKDGWRLHSLATHPHNWSEYRIVLEKEITDPPPVEPPKKPSDKPEIWRIRSRRGRVEPNQQGTLP